MQIEQYKEKIMNKKTNNYSKQMEIKVKATFTQRNKSVTKELTAKIDTESFTFKAISDFQKDLSKINTYIKKLTIDNVFFRNDSLYSRI